MNTKSSDFLEIERKFLVEELPVLADAIRVSISQGYLTETEDSVELRLRRADDARILTLKSGWGMTRKERNVALEPAQFDLLWPETEGRRLQKDRWIGPLPGGLRFELDIYHGALAPLRVVEVEFASEQEARRFVPPAWFGAEVTDDARYGNRVLVTAGLPEGE
ncbi:CYTH domain-containing protein [Pseudodonghicola flavimaris]|uniref:CYTH domain-containing protein n=1 Tax=Pseudodonghicola flavimaris TaxID=3050036 RepID=A0ABT7F142_9RHOB|nr:CYTH domain-containing protein [Pseudodonghicola flavimaris]MDK3018322.1 CYTH domain-containing protein [Pseudodonghicola flavimaris]